MPTAIERARALANSAKEQRLSGEQDAAIETLRSALPLLDDELAAGNDAAAGELADIYGQIGGALREEDRLLEAAAAYDVGHGYEVRHGLPSTYNALNRLVTRILLDPDAVVDPAGLRRYEQLQWVDVPAELSRLREVLARRVPGDIWTVGDVALTDTLTGSDPGDALDRLATDPVQGVRETYRPIVERLASLDTPRRAQLEKMLSVLT
jgi:hypothetical protein